MFLPRTNVAQSKLIRILVLSNILEWYDIYSYAYFSPILSKVFFGFTNSLYNLIGVFIIFGTAFLARFIGAFIFGRKGDLFGRKPAFLDSIIWVTITTFLMGCLPTYSQWGIAAPILLFILRISQSISSAGEVPGTLCFLYENSTSENRKYMMSWTAVGNQIGSILGLAGSLIITQFVSNSFLHIWGWRVSFWIGAVIGAFIIYIRNKLHETPEYLANNAKHKLSTEKLFHLLRQKQSNVIQGISYGFINAASYYLIATYIPLGLVHVMSMSNNYNSIMSLFILITTTITLPIFGAIAEKVNTKKMLIYSSIIMLFTLYPIYHAILTGNAIVFLIFVTIYVILNSCLTAALPYYLSILFTSPMRYTGTGLAFNISDGAIGGFTPVISIILYHYTGNPSSFCWFLAVCSLVSVLSFFKIKESRMQ